MTKPKHLPGSAIRSTRAITVNHGIIPHLLLLFLPVNQNIGHRMGCEQMHTAGWVPTNLEYRHRAAAMSKGAQVSAHVCISHWLSGTSSVAHQVGLTTDGACMGYACPSPCLAWPHASTSLIVEPLHRRFRETLPRLPTDATWHG